MFLGFFSVNFCAFLLFKMYSAKLKMSVCVSVQNLTGLQCGHEFCRNCWCQYLTVKICDEGMGQVCGFLSLCVLFVFMHCKPCLKISGPSASSMPNSVCSSWISTKYRTLCYLNITYGHTHYDVRTLPCVFSVMSL